MPDIPVVQVDTLRKTYRTGLLRRRSVEALKGVSLNVNRGEIFGLLGPNGAGKTTLIKILLGIVRRTGGKAELLGHSVGDRRSRLRIGYLPESHRIPRHLTGNQALEYYGQLSHLPKSVIRAKRDDILEIVGLSDWGRTSVTGYSKGMQQRLGLAQAMLHDPDLLILDEPTDGVDPVGRAEIRDVLIQLKNAGKTVFLNSHLLQEIELVCDRVAIMTHGTVRRTGTVNELTNADSGDVEIRLRGEVDQARQALEEFPPAGLDFRPGSANGVLEVVLHSPDQQQIDRVVDLCRGVGISIESISRPQHTLEEVFLRLVSDQEVDSE